jgi:hypothetical protein
LLLFSGRAEAIVNDGYFPGDAAPPCPRPTFA